MNKLKFSDVSKDIFRNKEFYDIVDAIKKRFEKRYAPIYDLCSKILDAIYNNRGYYYLLLGLVQSGKSLPISWLVWCLNFCKEFHKPTILLTINLDTVRRDFMGKIGPSGIVQQIVYEVCKELTNLNMEEINYFFCPRPFDLQKLKGKKVLETGEVPILIMQAHNYKGVIRSFLKFATGPTGPTDNVPIFIIDEVHSLYSDTKDFIDNKGIMLKNKDTSRAMISWLFYKVKEYKTCMLGITATPYRSMADTHVYPDKDCVYKLPLVAPFPNMKYYGEGAELSKKVNIMIRPHYVIKKDEEDLSLQNIVKTESFNCEIIREIMDRPAFKTSLTRVELPLVFITLERYNAKQEVLRDIIKQTFGDSVYCQVINQNGDPKLDEYFNECLESEKVSVCVIIGNNSLKAGISVKPAPGTSCKKLVNGQEYYISGITDQISDFSEINGESDMQLLRILGWYPEKHQCNLWLADENAKNNYYELYNIYKQFEYLYNGHPSTVSEISTTADKICGGYCHYARSTRKNSKVHKQFTKLHDTYELKTQVIFLADLPDLDINKYLLEEKVEKIVDLFKKAGVRNKFRAELFSALKKSNIIFDATRFQIPTSKQRLNEIIDSAFLPGDKDQWKVNSFLYGLQGEDSNLMDSYIIWFDEPYDVRPTLSESFPNLCFWLGSTHLASTLCLLNTNNDLDFKETESWVSATFKPIMIHKNLDAINMQLADIHDSTIEQMTKLSESERETILSSWHLCMKACKLVTGSGSVQTAKSYYDKRKVEMQLIGKSELLEHEKLEKIVMIVKDLHKIKK